MFPYPSGKLHVGHVRNYTMGDLVARYRRAQGFNVLHPMGWDAFGLPAENAAIAGKIHPAVWTCENIATMRAQLQRMGFAYDWSREIATCHPEYYRHEQKMFLDFLAAGLAYRKESWVNWDPVENTVLANEQVIDGRGWRSGAIVEKRLLSQWFLRITAFTEELLDAIADARTLAGARAADAGELDRPLGRRARAFSDRRSRRARSRSSRRGQDTLFGASFLALSPNHPLALRLAEKRPGARRLHRRMQPHGHQRSGDRDRREARLSHRRWRRCIRSTRRRQVPVYVANFVLMEYGTGAIFGCPAHDQRDLEFARKYGLPVIPVVLPPGEDPAAFHDRRHRLCRGRHAVQLRLPRRALGRRGEAGRRRAARAAGPRRAHDRLPPARLGRVAAALLGLPDPGHPLPEIAASCRCRSRTCRSSCREDVSFRRPGQPARPPPDLEARRLPALRRAGPARDRHLRHLLRIVLVFPALLLGARAGRLRARSRRLLDAGRPVHRRRRARRPAPALFALLHPGVEAVRLSRSRRAVRRAVHARHGLPPDLSERDRGMALPGGGRDRRPTGGWSMPRAGR